MTDRLFQRQVKKFVLVFNCRLLLLDEQTTFHPSITHLITDEIDSEYSLVCTLTKTVLFAIAQHCFILSYRWICQCLVEHVLINEEQFEIEGDHIIAHKHNGPRRSRLSKQPLLPLNHFSNCCFDFDHCDDMCFSSSIVMIKGSTGHFLDLTNTELGDLAWLAGGIYIEQNRFPNTVFPRQCYLLIEDEDIRNKVKRSIMSTGINTR